MGAALVEFLDDVSILEIPSVMKTYFVVFVDLDVQDQIPNLFAPLPVRVRSTLRALYSDDDFAHDLKLPPVDPFLANNSARRWLSAVAFSYDAFQDADAWVGCERGVCLLLIPDEG